MVLFLKKFTKNTAELSENEQLIFLKRLYRLLESGYSFLEALQVIKWDHTLKKAATEVISSIKTGKYIDEAFEQTGFHSTIVSYLFFVRYNGDFSASLNHCISMFEQRLTYMRKFKQVIRYPLVLSVFFFLLLFFLKTSVLPAFEEIFAMNNSSSSTLTISMTMIHLFITCLFISCMIALLVAIFWKFYKRQFPIHKQIIIYQKIPIYRTILKLQTSYYFSTHINMYLKAGMSLKNILEQLKTQNHLPILRYYVELMYQQLQSGHYVHPLLLELAFIDRPLALLFERQNNQTYLEKDLEAYATMLTEQMEQKVMRVITLVQPLFFGFLAVMILFVYISLMWPMFQLITTI